MQFDYTRMTQFGSWSGWIEIDGEMVPNYDATISEFSEGDVVTGKVVRIDKDEVLIDIGYKSEGVIPLNELSIRKSVNVDDEVQLGEMIDAVIAGSMVPRAEMEVAAATYLVYYGNHIAKEDEDILGNVRRNAAGFRERIDSLLDLPIVGDVRGDGYFLALELVPDKDKPADHFTRDAGEDLLRNFLSLRLLEAGLVCRTDDRGDPVVQLSPPLVAGETEFDFIETTLRTCLTEAWKRMH